MSETKKGLLCLLSEICYLAVIGLLLALRLYVKVPLLNQIVAFIGLLAVDLCPWVSLITGSAAAIFHIRGLVMEQSKMINALLLALAVAITALSCLCIRQLQPVMFYG